jgi:hypothetical protein
MRRFHRNEMSAFWPLKLFESYSILKCQLNCLGGESFCSFENFFLLRYCTDWCNGQKQFARLKIDLQTGIFGIIAQSSDFPEKPLQNCKSDMTP